jgi:hypothetical protein
MASIKRRGFRAFWPDRADFYRDLAESLREKELLRDFIQGEIDCSEKGSPRLKVLMHMRKMMNVGEANIATLLEAVMPDADRLALAVLRTAPDTALVLDRIANSVEIEASMRTSLRKALIPPVFLVGVSIIFVAVIVFGTLPAFEQSAPPEIWVGLAWAIRAFANVLRDYGPGYLFLLILFWAWLYAWGLQNWRNRFRTYIETCSGLTRRMLTFAFIPLGPIVPMIILYRDYQASKVLDGLALVISSGRQLNEAIEEIMLGASPWLRNHLRYVLDHLIRQPGDYVEAFGKGILSQHLKARMMSKSRRDFGGAFAPVVQYLGTSGQLQARITFEKKAKQLNFTLAIAAITVIIFLYFGQSYIAFKMQDSFTPDSMQRRLNESQTR